MTKAPKFVSAVTSLLFTIGLMWSLPSQAADHEVKFDADNAWKFTCSIVNCGTLPQPKVQVEPYDNETCGRAWGYYNPILEGEDVVHICMGNLFYADPIYTNSVIAHEMTHYVDFHTDPDGLVGCPTEWNGHRVGNAYVYTYGHPEWADFDWQEWYRCYGPSYSEELYSE